jgi:hypothetical protein
MTEPLPQKLENWLTQVGFVNGNPFATVNAEQEGAFLPEYFVDTGHYSLILGDPQAPRSTLVFAPRGCGKTAYRVMLERGCYPHSSQTGALAVTHTSFDRLFEVAEGSVRERLNAHVSAIVQKGLHGLVSTLSLHAHLAERVDALRGMKLRALLQGYAPELLTPPAVWQALRLADPGFDASWERFERSFVSGRLTPVLVKSEGDHRPTLTWWVQVISGTKSTHAYPSSAFDDFVGFVGLVRELGIAGLYVTVDRLDELPETVDRPDAVAELVLPLISHLPLMETEGVGFKFFLPMGTLNLLQESPRARLDRLPVHAIRWSDDLLAQMLEKRLVTFSAGNVRSLDQLASTQLADSIESELVQAANGSPRRLLRLGELFFMERARRMEKDDLLLTRGVWEAAYAAFNRRYPPPPLVVDDGVPQVWVGRRAVGLTSLEHKFLLALYQGGGWREKEPLIMEVWDTVEGVSDQAVSRLVRRIREKIEPFPGAPIYLLTEHNQGFRLEHLGEAVEA